MLAASINYKSSQLLTAKPKAVYTRPSSGGAQRPADRDAFQSFARVMTKQKRSSRPPSARRVGSRPFSLHEGADADATLRADLDLQDTVEDRVCVTSSAASQRSTPRSASRYEVHQESSEVPAPSPSSVVGEGEQHSSSSTRTGPTVPAHRGRPRTTLSPQNRSQGR